MRLSEIDLDKFNPPPLSKAETLHRYRLQLAALTAKVVDAGEEKYPGISLVCLDIDAKIQALEKEQA